MEATAYLTPLQRLNELHQLYNGPIPEPLLTVARLGSVEMAALCLAEGQSAFFTAMVKGQLKILRYAKASGWIIVAIGERGERAPLGH